MRADDVIALRRLWGLYSYPLTLPTATVVASPDWVAYVLAMAASMPVDATLVQPVEKEIEWAWPDGVAIVFAEPLEVEHAIVSVNDETGRAIGGGSYVKPVEPRWERHEQSAFVVSASGPVYTRNAGTDELAAVDGRRVMWLGTNAENAITGTWIPGYAMIEAKNLGHVSQASRLGVALLTALGHRLTRLADPPTSGRAERRRVGRELPGGLRLLELSSGASVRRTDEPSAVEWQRRWMVRGHWRQQPCGPRRSQRRLQWIDPFVKGPEDKPLDVRPTVWRARAPEATP